MQQHTQDALHVAANHVGNTTAVAALLGTLAGWLPNIAALFTIIWTLIKIWETKTVQCWRAKLKLFKRK